MYQGFEYGCYQPTSNLPACIDQMRLRNQLWNKFVEIDHAYREKRDVLLHVPEQEELDGLFKELADLRKILKAAKKKLPRKRHAEDPLLDLASQIKDVEARLMQKAAVAGVIADGTLTAAQARKEAIKALRKVIGQKRREKAEQNRPLLDAYEAERKLAANLAQRESHLYWGNYDDLRTCYEAARWRAIKDHVQLHFHRWDGTGKLSVRWQSGVATKDLFGEDSRLQIQPVPEEAYTSPIRAERRRLIRTIARIKTYDDQQRLIFVELPVFLHRPLAPDGRVRTAAIVRQRVASDFRYSLVLSVDNPPVRQRVGPSVTIALCHIRPIATWEGDDGRKGLVELPESLIGNFLECNNLQSLIDQKFNAARTALTTWMESHRIPKQLKERTVFMAQWRSPRRFWLLVKDWERFKGDEMIYAALQAWQTKHTHLWEWKRHLEDQMVRARREEYRKFAARMAADYAVLRITKADLAQKKRKPQAESDRVAPAGRTRDVAAHGVLRGVLKNAFLQTGGTVEGLENSEDPSASATMAGSA